MTAGRIIRAHVAGGLPDVGPPGRRWEGRAPLDGPRRTIGRPSVVFLTALALAATLGATAAPVAQGAWSCRVRNATQGTSDTSLIRMVGEAVDGDRLWVRGTCRGPVVIDVDIVISGADDTAVLTGRYRMRVVRVRRDARATLRGLVIQEGRPSAEVGGGGILNRGRLTLDDGTVQYNWAADSGGGIMNDGTLTLTDTVVRGNHVEFGDGGGIANGGTLSLTRSAVVDNTSDGSAGGIHNGGTLTVTDSVVRGNENRAEGIGGIANLGTLALVRSIVAGNTAFYDGGIGNFGAATATLTDSVVRGNRAREDGFGGIGNGGTLTLVRSIVRDNSTRYDGGGIINYGAGTLTLIGSVVRGNSARRGGGVWNSGELILTGSTVTGNTARRAGGGIWNDDDPADPGTVTLDATSSVTGNTPDDCVGTPAC